MLRTGQSPGSPLTPSRRSLRLLAKQLYQEELEASKDTEKHLPKTPQHSRLDTELKHTVNESPTRKLRKDTETEPGNKPVVMTTPPQISVHSHFLDSRQLNAADAAADSDKSPARRPSLRSPSRHEMTEAVRRSPRLVAKQDNLLHSPSSATKTYVRPLSNITLLFLFVTKFIITVSK